MRRSLLLALPALLALVPAAPSSAGFGQCVSTGGVTVCPTAVSRCTAGERVGVTVVGSGQGTASCGGVSASCYAFRVTCSDTSARATTSGILTCSATNAAVAYCAVLIEAS